MAFPRIHCEFSFSIFLSKLEEKVLRLFAHLQLVTLGFGVSFKYELAIFSCDCYLLQTDVFNMNTLQMKKKVHRII